LKRCPTCKRTYDDDTLSFCLEDGTPLTRDPSATSDSEVTLVSPSPNPPGDAGTSGDLLSTRAYDQLPGRPTVSASQTPVAPPYPIYSAPPTQRKVWPWVLAIVAVLFVGIIAIVAVAIVVPQLSHPSPNTNPPASSPLPIASPSTESGPSPNNSPGAYEGDDVPTDEDEVLEQLKNLENEWEQANVAADKEALDKILADDYRDDDGNKQDYLNSIKPSPGRKWRYSDFSVELDGDRAELTYKLDRITDEGTNSYSFVDKFVWRDHRWQATSSRSTRLQ
jgi:hypothetical protein